MIKNLVSVIIPVYNVEKYLEECLNSIVKQTYSNLEIILIDDGSKDDSGIICDEFAKKDFRIRVFHQKNAGVSNARNFGLSICNGEYFTFVDGDDTIYSTYIELMVDEIKKNDVDLVRLSWKRGNKDCTYFANFDREGRFFVSLSNIGDLLWFANIWGLFKSENLNPIRFDQQLKYAEDNLFVLEYFLKSQRKRMLLLDRPYYYYRISENSATQIDVFKRLERSEKFVEKVLRLDCGFDFRFLVSKYVYNDYLVVLYYLVDNKLKKFGSISLNGIREKIKELRKNGCREFSLGSTIISFLYRHHLHILVHFFRKVRIK